MTNATEKFVPVSRPQDVQPGDEVRKKHNPNRAGVVLNGVAERKGGSWRLPVRWVNEDERRWEYIEDLLRVVPSDDATKDSARGYAPSDALSLALMSARLSGRQGNVLFSMKATRTDFHPHQYRPLLQFLRTPARGVLIADEVGLGKTIEAGLIWTELRARMKARRLLVICPAALRDKWLVELETRFGVLAENLNADGLLRWLKEANGSPESSWAGVISYHGVAASESPSGEIRGRGKVVAEYIESLTGRLSHPLVDLMIADESHYMRNDNSFYGGVQSLQRVVDRAVFLSATPLQMRNDDMHRQLGLLDELSFPDMDTTRKRLEANVPIVRAQNLLRSPDRTFGAVLGLVREARERPLFRGNQVLAAVEAFLLERPAAGIPDEKEVRELLHLLDDANLIGQALTRTTRREVIHHPPVRQPVRDPIEMSDAEREAYLAVQEIVRDYAKRKGIDAGFLLTMPLRQLSSSMVAATDRWLAGDDTTDASDLEAAGLGKEEVRPLVAALAEGLAGRVDRRALRDQDSKYERLKTIILERDRTSPGQKLILFSTFPQTLRYLEDRLAGDGIHAVRIDGRTPVRERPRAVEDFRLSRTARVLLTSEVLSEGVDMQFCSVLINYDLPWNPARLEQRIGRIDRLGQKSETLQILSLVFQQSIDDRVYQVLYERLKLIEDTVGDLGPALGEELEQAIGEYLKGDLTDEELERRLDEARLAEETRRKNLHVVAAEAAFLPGVGREIIESIQRMEAGGRYVRDEDLLRFTQLMLRMSFPQARLRAIDGDLYELTTTDALRMKMQDNRDPNDLRSGARLLRDGQAQRVRFRHTFDPAGEDGLVETIHLGHPLIRALLHEHRSHDPECPVAVLVEDPPALPDGQLLAGLVCFRVERWSVASPRWGHRSQLHFLWTGPDGIDAEGEQVEEALLYAARHGRPWPDAARARDVDDELIRSLGDRIESRGRQAFTTFRDEELRAFDDRRALQLNAWQEWDELRVRGYEERIAEHRSKGSTLEFAEAAKLERHRLVAEQRRAEIEKEPTPDIQMDPLVWGIIQFGTRGAV